MSLNALLDALPEAHRKHLDPSSPAPMRMMASRGMAPLPPREMVVVLCGLTLDADSKLAEGAKTTLAQLPAQIVGPAVEGGLPAAAFAPLLPTIAGREELLEKVVLQRQTPDEAIAAIAPEATERVATIIAGNQERCLRSEAIVRALRNNSNLLRSTMDRLFDFLVRSGVIYDDMPEFSEAMARLSPTEVVDAAITVGLPQEVAGYLQQEESVEYYDEEAGQLVGGREKAGPNEDVFDEDEVSVEAGQPDQRLPILKLLTTLTTPQKVALAVRGNKEARSILVRDSNKMVASAAIRSPRITEQEVVAAAQSRSVCDDVVRIIAASKELSRSYGVKLALVNNPKTPLPTAMRLLSLLRQSDLKSLAKSKNVSAAVANQAKRMLLKKTGGAR